jgi:hypothetical protein
MRKKTVAVTLPLGAAFGMAGAASADHTGGRADGVCCGVGAGHYNPATGEPDLS